MFGVEEFGRSRSKVYSSPGINEPGEPGQAPTPVAQSQSTQQQMQGMISGPDPSNIYRTKLEQMSTGQFAPNDPSYQFRVQEGQQALERSQAARGMAGGGSAAIELQQYGQRAASQEYGAQFQRMLQALSGVESQYQSQYSRLAELAGIQLGQQGLDIQSQAQRFGQSQATSRDIGIGEGLNKIQQQMSGEKPDYMNLFADTSSGDTEGGGYYYPQYNDGGSGYISGSNSGVIQTWGGG